MNFEQAQKEMYFIGAWYNFLQNIIPFNIVQRKKINDKSLIRTKQFLGLHQMLYGKKRQHKVFQGVNFCAFIIFVWKQLAWLTYLALQANDAF